MLLSENNIYEGSHERGEISQWIYEIRQMLVACGNIFCSCIDSSVEATCPDVSNISCLVCNCCNVYSDIGDYCGENTELVLQSHPFATKALQCLLYRLYLCKKGRPYLIEVIFPSVKKFMKCDTNSYEMMRIFDREEERWIGNVPLRGLNDENESSFDNFNIQACVSCNSRDVNSKKSLFSILNNCCTNMGKKMLKNWLKRPLADIDLVNNRLKLVDLFTRKLQLRAKLQEALKGIPDIGNIGNMIF